MKFPFVLRSQYDDAMKASDEGEISADDPRWHRIVACVNFCRGMNTGVLQFYGAPLPDEKPGRVPAEEWAQTIAHD